MGKPIMICGVDCKRGDEHCNGYCLSLADSPPDATQEMIISRAREKANKALDEAEKAWYAYAGLCDVGPDRVRAFEVYENVRLARRL